MLTDHVLAYIGQYALIKNAQGKILLIEYIDTKTWSLPGGCLEEGEDWLSSLQREIHEETNLEVVKAAVCAVQFTQRGESPKYCIYFKTEVKTFTGLSSEDPKKKRLAWVSKKKIPAVKFFSEKTKKIVIDFLEE